MTQAPPAIVKLAAEFAKRTDRPKSYVMAGIVGNAAHMSPPEGYHVSARDEHFNWGAYSLSTTRDRAGGKAYPDYASAWDLHFGPADMVLVTTRLINAAKDPHDNRLHAVAEIAGTTNDHTVHAYYENTETDDPTDKGGWDSGHLTHVHLSISRDDCNNYAALAPILDVLCGVPLYTDDLLEEIAMLPGAPKDLTYQKLVADVAEAVWSHPVETGDKDSAGKLVVDKHGNAETSPAESYLKAIRQHEFLIEAELPPPASK